MKRPVPDEVVLGLLKIKPAHGYELLEQFQDPAELGRIWTMSTSQIYAVLKRLEANGLLTGKEVLGEDAPNRVVYTITEKGQQSLESWLYDDNLPASIHRIRVLFLSRLYIALKLNLSLGRIIKNQKKVCKKHLIALEKERQKEGSMLEQLTLDFVIGQLQAAMAWLQHCDVELKAKNTPKR